MRWTDREIGDAIRELDPPALKAEELIASEARAYARFAAALSNEQTSEPARQMRQPRRPARWRLAGLPVGIAATVAVAVLVVGNVLAGPAHDAEAYGPPPLPFTTIDATVAEVIDDAQRLLAGDRTGSAEVRRDSASTGWYSEIQGGSTTDGLTAIEPQIRELNWEADLSGSLTVTAGAAYTADGTSVADTVDPPGTVLFETTFAAGEFAPRDPAVPRTDIPSLTATVHAFSSAEATQGAADHALGIAGLLGTWTLTNDHHEALLEILGSGDDAEVAGATTDRGGRPAIGLRATSAVAPWIDVVVLISTDTGRIVGIEEVYAGVGDELPIPTGTVIAYTIWETTS